MQIWDQVSIVGVGLIGGSIGKCLKSRRLVHRVVGIGRREESLALARNEQAIDEGTTSLAEGVARAQLVVVCTPVQQIVADVQRAAAACQNGTLITDAGSTKREIVEGVERHPLPPGVHFVGSHPIAGGDASGPGAAREGLFQDRMTVITPGQHSREEHLQTIESFWKSLGARVTRMSPEQHDRILAMTSHLPHLVAAALAGTTPRELLAFTGAGWADTTRIARGNAALWRQIACSNRDAILQAMDQLQAELQSYAQALRGGDESIIEKLLSKAKEVRDALGS